VARRDSGGPWRRRWDLLKDFLVGSLQPGDLARHLVLTGGKLVHGLPQRGETQRYLLHLLRVEGGGSRGLSARPPRAQSAQRVPPAASVRDRLAASSSQAAAPSSLSSAWPPATSQVPGPLSRLSA